MSVLGRLGFHASDVDVIAELAKYRIEVSAGLFHKVKIEAMKDTSGVRRRTAAITEPHPRLRVVRRTTAGRRQEK